MSTEDRWWWKSNAGWVSCKTAETAIAEVIDKMSKRYNQMKYLDDMDGDCQVIYLNDEAPGWNNTHRDVTEGYWITLYTSKSSKGVTLPPYFEVDKWTRSRVRVPLPNPPERALRAHVGRPRAKTP